MSKRPTNLPAPVAEALEESPDDGSSGSEGGMDDPDDIVGYAPGYRPGSLSLGTSTTDSSDETSSDETDEEEEGEEVEEEEEENTDEEDGKPQEAACERVFSQQKRDLTGQNIPSDLLLLLIPIGKKNDS